MDEPRTLPEGLVAARRTPVFTIESVPPALLDDHHTAVWAQLIVIDGTVRFVEASGRSTVATPATPVVIVPHHRHRIEPSVDARFTVQFYDDA